MDGHRRRYQDVAEILKKEMASGNYKVGDRLRPERQISEELEVSRSLVREAMIMLEIEGKSQIRSRKEVAADFENMRKDYNESSSKLGQNIGMILTAIGVLALVAGFVILGLSFGHVHFAAALAAKSTELLISCFAGGGTFFGAGLALTLYHRPDTAARRLNKLEKMHKLSEVNVPQPSVL